VREASRQAAVTKKTRKKMMGVMSMYRHGAATISASSITRRLEPARM